MRLPKRLKNVKKKKYAYLTLNIWNPKREGWASQGDEKERPGRWEEKEGRVMYVKGEKKCSKLGRANCIKCC